MKEIAVENLKYWPEEAAGLQLDQRDWINEDWKNCKFNSKMFVWNWSTKVEMTESTAKWCPEVQNCKFNTAKNKEKREWKKKICEQK
jgi:hypothetical protein